MPPPESARISTLRRRWPGSWARASRVDLDVVGGGVGPGVPGPQHDGQRLTGPAGPWSAKAVSGWNPKVFFQVGLACSFSECAVTTVASMSTVTSPPSAPGAAPPASAQARSRAAARAARIAFSARGASAASCGDQPGDHRVRGHRPGQVRLRAQHRDIGQAVTAQRHRHRQVRDDLPRIVHRPRRPPPRSPADKPPVQARHVARSCAAVPLLPGNDPRPVSGHRRSWRRAVRFTRKVPFELARNGPSTSPILPVQGTFLI